MAKQSKTNSTTVRGKAKLSKSAAGKTGRSASPKARVTDILERVSDGFVAFDKDMNYTYVNARGGELLGRKPEDLIGKNYWKEYPEAKGTPFADAYVRALESQEPIVFENYYAPWDRWFENRVYPSKDGLSVFFSEVTERKRAEEKIAYQANLLANVNDAVIASDENFVLASWNHAAERIYGWKAEEVIGKSGAEILQTEFLTISRPEAIKQLIESGEYNAEVSQPRKDGTKIYIETRTTALRDTNGKTIGYVSINRDITERKEAEKKLRLSEELFSNAFHASPAGIVITRIADGKIIDANESFLNMFEFSRAETIGHTSIELNIFTPEERAKIIQQQIASGGLQNFEFTSRTKSGKPINLLSSSKPMEIKGELCHITTMIDITERKRAEETLRMRVNELAALYKTSQSLQKLLEPEPLSQEIVELLEKTLSYEYGAVLLIEEPGTRMIPFAVVGLERGEEFIRQDKEFIASRSVEVGKGVTGWVAQHGESALIGDVRKDPRYYALRENIKSEMCAPLRTGDKVIGVINVESPRLNAYNENDLRVLETVAAQISISIQNARLLEETRLSRDRLAELSRRLVETHESEQRAIGRELHDQIGQMLTALKLTLEIAAQLPPEAAAKKIVTANELVDDLMSRVSRLSLELRPPMLDELGLIPALLWQVNRFQEQSGIVVDFKHTGMEGKRFDPEIETTAYRIVQESLTNVARHSRATRVGLEVRAGGGQVEILIEDNGKGFDPQAALAKNRGLSGMRERAGLVGGTFEIQSEPGKGTRKFLRLPLRESAA